MVPANILNDGAVDVKIIARLYDGSWNRTCTNEFLYPTCILVRSTWQSTISVIETSPSQRIVFVLPEVCRLVIQSTLLHRIFYWYNGTMRAQTSGVCDIYAQSIVMYLQQASLPRRIKTLLRLYCSHRQLDRWNRSSQRSSKPLSPRQEEKILAWSNFYHQDRQKKEKLHCATRPTFGSCRSRTPESTKSRWRFPWRSTLPD